MCTGDIDTDKVVAGADNLKATLRSLTGRGDLSLGDIAYVTDYRSVPLSYCCSPWLFDLPRL